MKWNEKLEHKLLLLRDKEEKTYREIADILNTTLSSVKHKYIRLKQSANDDKHHHPKEKIEQIKKFVSGIGLEILETNAGWGNLTQVYQMYGNVMAHDIEKDKVDHLRSLKYEHVHAIKCDSFREIHGYVFHGYTFDIIDLDSYGMPSRYFPHIFQLMKDGILFVTFPKIGVQQLNKITIEHYRVFWNITLDDKDQQVELIVKKMKEYAFQHFRSLEMLDYINLGRMYRFAFKVKKESALDLVDLKVKGIND
jgi:hypothetical protein